MKNEKMKNVLLIAIFKGLLNALIIPLGLMFIMLNITQDMWAFLTPFAWLMFATVVYGKSKDKDISAMVFFNTLKFLLLITLVFLLMIAS